MQQLFQAINQVFTFIGPLSDFLWDFPTNFEWYPKNSHIGKFLTGSDPAVGEWHFLYIQIGVHTGYTFKKGC